MRLKCKVCKEEFVSFELDKEKALTELSSKIAQHLATKHQQASAVIAQIGIQCSQVATWYTMLQRYSQFEHETGERQDYVAEKVEESIDKLMGMLGFDVDKPSNGGTQPSSESTSAA